MERNERRTHAFKPVIGDIGDAFSPWIKKIIKEIIKNNS
jgi:hypothetical protein